MPDIITYKWDSDPNYSSNFFVITKYYELGSVHIPKNIYSMSVTLGTPEGESLTLSNTINILYRTEAEERWNIYGMFSFTAGVGTRTVKKKIINVPGIQLKLTGFLGSSVYINDIAIEYRIRRKKNVGSPE